MNFFPLRIAWRYLFAKKTHNAINIITGVSAFAISVVTAALICVMSVMNGFEALVRSMFSNFDSELRIEARVGKTFSTDAPEIQKMLTLNEIAIANPTIEEIALLRYKSKQIPAQLKGVGEHFAQTTHIDSVILDGTFCVFDGAFENCVFGIGVANDLGVRARFIDPIRLYAPRRTRRVNMLRPDKSFITENAFIAGVFSVQQQKYDNNYVLVSLNLARKLFEYAPNEVSALEIKTRHGDIKSAKRQIQNVLGSNFRVLDRYEQQEDFFRIVHIEKILTTLLLVFILLIAIFNSISTLSMLILEKQDDARILFSLGATRELIRYIFLLEGWLISLLGALFGTILGVTICAIQERFGLLTLGSGTEFVIHAYPVKIEFLDILFVIVVVLLLGYLSAYIPTRSLKKRNF